MPDSMIEAFEEVLGNALPESELIRLDDARRLTGPGLLWSCQGAVLDIYYEKLSLAPRHCLIVLLLGLRI